MTPTCVCIGGGDHHSHGGQNRTTCPNFPCCSFHKPNPLHVDGTQLQIEIATPQDNNGILYFKRPAQKKRIRGIVEAEYP